MSHLLLSEGRVYAWRQTKPNVAASKNGRKWGNKTEFCYHWVQCLTNMLEYIFHCCAQNYCVSSSHIHVYDLSWFMSQFLVKCLVNGEFFQLGGFVPIASQLQLLKLLENMVNCSLDNLEIIFIVYYKRPLGEMCDCKKLKVILVAVFIYIGLVQSEQVICWV